MNGADLSKLPPEKLRAEADAIDREIQRRKRTALQELTLLKRNKGGRPPLPRCEKCGKPKQATGHRCK